MRFWVGGFGPDGHGSAEGIGVLRAGDDASPFAGGPLAFTGTSVPAESPSWVARHPTLDVVYAALEKRGEVRAYRRVGAQGLAPLGPTVAAGEAVCHVAIAPDGRFLVASCWGDGRVVTMRLDDGRPGDPVIAPAAVDPHGAAGPGDTDRTDAADPRDARAGDGRDPAGRGRRGDGSALDTDVEDDRDRDADLAAAARALRDAAGEEFAHLVPDFAEPLSAAPAGLASVGPASAGPDDEPRVSRAHQARFLPGGLVVTTDLGFDLVRLWRPTATGLRSVGEVVLPRGTGPRHTAWHPSGHLYVLTELSLEVFVLAPDAAGRWRIVSATPLAAGTLPGDTAAEIALSHDRAFAYCGVRGSDTIATLRVSCDGSALAPVALDDAGVIRPRHHLVVRDTLLVAGRTSDDVVSRTLDIRTGVPGRVRQRTPVPSPTCLARIA